ncbi:MAG: tetratricopeptide repeat protein [Acidobacteria bacterium]|nr:tetratricopeptide repeat protein [Acidobacteriota bacterium]
MSEFEWEDGLRQLDSALSLNPASAYAHFWRAHILCGLGRAEESLAAAHRAAELDPLFALFRAYCALFCLYMGRTERAMEYALQALDVDANHPIARLALGEAFSQSGRHEDGISLMEKVQTGLPPGYFYIGFLAHAYVRAGRRDDAVRLRTALEEQSNSRFVSASALAFIAMALGDLEAVFRWAGEAADEHDPNINLSIRSPYFHPLRSDSRYTALLRRMNLRP